MKKDFFKKYNNQKEEIIELKELEKELEPYFKKTIIDKILESKLIDKTIYFFHDIYKKISEKLLIKYDLKNELKQGKLFTILIAILIFLFLILFTIFFVIMLNSLLGINLIFQTFKYSIFLLKWSYTLLKSKGKIIKKYLFNLFPNNQILKESNDIKIEGLPVFETYILNEIDSIINNLKYINISNIELKKEIIEKIKKIVEKLDLNNQEDIIKDLIYKSNIIKDVTNIKNYVEEILIKQEEEKKLFVIKENINNKLNDELEVKEKVLIKKK